MARLVFVGRMLPGPSTSLDRAHVLGSPASVRVLRYLKGSGPTTVKVRTAVTIKNRGVTVAEDGIEPQVGEIWKIYTDSRGQPLDTSICGGSKLLRSAARVALRGRSIVALCRTRPFGARLFRRHLPLTHGHDIARTLDNALGRP